MGFLTTGYILLISSSIACIFFSVASATSSLAPLSQILQTESIPGDVLSIFSHYFPSSLLTDYSAVSHELSILMDSTGVTVLEGTKTSEYGTGEEATESYTEISGGVGSTAATPTAVSATLTATTIPSTTIPSSLSASVTAIISGTMPSASASATAASSSSGSGSSETTSQSSTSTAGATSFVGSPSCLGMILAISVACLFGTLV
ncbi:hypothetical protein V1522DRAFT_404432 [Lipomyces starkeyi]